MIRFQFAILTILLFILGSCARIPASSVELTDMLIAEGERMHRLNITLVNKMFDEKQKNLDEFIENEYLPKFIEEFTSNIPEGTDLESELPAILLALVPEVTSRRNAMHRALEEQRVKLITKLDEDFDNFRLASLELRNLLNSAVRVDEERSAMYAKVSELSGGKIDLDKMEHVLDNFIIEAGDLSEKAIKLNEEINSIIDKN